jgi:hypothetical protein
MATRKRRAATKTEPGTIDELVRVMVLFLKYQGAPQGALVHDLSNAGLTPARIAELIQTSANSVSQQKRQKRPVWPPPS